VSRAFLLENKFRAELQRRGVLAMLWLTSRLPRVTSGVVRDRSLDFSG